MSELPDYYEYLKTAGDGSNLLPFHYDERKKYFVIGSSVVNLADFDPYEYSPPKIGLSYEGIPPNQIPCYPLLISIRRFLMTTPKFDQYVGSNPDILEDTGRVMHESFSLLTDGRPMSAIDDLSADRKFTAYAIKYGGISLTAPSGEQSHLRPTADNFYLEGVKDKGFSEYHIYESENIAERTSLFAGIGHIAWKSFEGNK